MIYQNGSNQLNCIQIILDNDVNKICVCENISNNIGERFVTVELKEHEASLKVIKIFFEGRYTPDDVKNMKIREHTGLLDFFSCDGHIVMLFPYTKPRNIKDFYIGTKYHLSVCEELCINIILLCIQSGLPYPLLYLLLKQNLVSVNPDNSVYFNYMMDLSEIDASITEKECVVETARLLLWVLEPYAETRAISYELLQKRVASSGYFIYTELYKDVTMAAAPHYKRNIFTKVIDFFKNNKDQLFRVLLVICIILASFVLLSLITQMIFGDVPWLRLFCGSFKVIGTESLVK